MNLILHPCNLFCFFQVSWINRKQQHAIEYLKTVNQVLREKLGKKRILLNGDQRLQLGVKGKVLSRQHLSQIWALFTPDTILRWHRELVVAKWNYSDKRKVVGGTRVGQVIVVLIIRFAREDPA